MEEQREEGEFIGDCREPMEEEVDKGLDLSSKTETLVDEDTSTVDASVIDVDPNDGVSANEDGNTDNFVSDEKQVKADVINVEDRVDSVTGEECEDKVDVVERADDITEPETERTDMECDRDAGTDELKPVDETDDVQRISETVNVETAKSEVNSKHGESHESVGEEESVMSGGNEVTDVNAKCDVEDNGGACDGEQNVQTEMSQQGSDDGEMLSVAENKADVEKESTKESKDDNKLGVDGEQEKEEKVSHSYDEQGYSGCENSDADKEKESAKDIDKEKESAKDSDKEKKLAKDSEADNKTVSVDEQRISGSETNDAKHSESAIVAEESLQPSEGATNEGNTGTVSEVSSATEINDEGKRTTVNQKEEEGEAMEIDYAAEEQVKNDVEVGGALDNVCNVSAGASVVPQDIPIADAVVQPQDIPIADTDMDSSNVVMTMELDELKDNADMASDLTETIKSADITNPSGPSEDAAPGEVEPVDHNALFDPSSDIANFIDFSGVSSWSGNIQDLKAETRNVSLKEDKKADDMTEDVATVSEARAATDCSKEASDAILGSERNQEDKDHECLDKKTADQQDTIREEEHITHEAPSIHPNQKEDTQMEENPNNSDYADDEAGSDIRTNGVKRKADVLGEDSPGEGRKTVSFAKVSFAQRPSFKIGACIARAASQMAGSSSVLKGSNFDDETLSVESFVSQLHCAATEPDKENVVSDIAAGFFLDFRNSSALQQGTPKNISNKRGRPSNSNVAGTEAFEFDEMGDTYWTDRVIHNGGEEQTPPTEKGNYQIVPVELKPSQVQRTRRPYRRRQSQINIPLSLSDKPANFDENAPAELVMKFSEADTIPPEKSLSKMFSHFGPIRESQTEVDKENNRARVVFRKGADAEVAYNSAGRFNIFGKKAVNYELSYTITEIFKVQPYVVSLGEEDTTLFLPS